MPNRDAKSRKQKRRKLNDTLKREGRTRAQRDKIARKRAKEIL